MQYSYQCSIENFREVIEITILSKLHWDISWSTIMAEQNKLEGMFSPNEVVGTSKNIHNLVRSKCATITYRCQTQSSTCFPINACQKFCLKNLRGRTFHGWLVDLKNHKKYISWENLYLYGTVTYCTHIQTHTDINLLYRRVLASYCYYWPLSFTGTLPFILSGCITKSQPMGKK